MATIYAAIAVAKDGFPVKVHRPVKDAQVQEKIAMATLVRFVAEQANLRINQLFR